MCKKFIHMTAIVTGILLCAGLVSAEAYYFWGNGQPNWDHLAAPEDELGAGAWAYWNTETESFANALALPTYDSVTKAGDDVYMANSDPNVYVRITPTTSPVATCKSLGIGSLEGSYGDRLDISGILDMGDDPSIQRVYFGPITGGLAYDVNSLSEHVVNVLPGADIDISYLKIVNSDVTVSYRVNQTGGNMYVDNLGLANVGPLSTVYVDVSGGMFVCPDDSYSVSPAADRPLIFDIQGTPGDCGTVILQSGRVDVLLGLGFIKANGVVATAENIDSLLAHVPIDITKKDSSVQNCTMLTLPTDKAWGPAPADGSSNVSIYTDLSWYIPTPADANSWSYEVYFGTNPTPGGTPILVGATNDSPGIPAVLTNAQIGGPLPSDTYYWRVDAIEPNALGDITHTGDIWMFETAPLPTLIAPDDTYTPTVNIDVNLEWFSEASVAASKIIMTPAGEAPIDLGIKTSPFNPYADAGITMEWDKQYTWQVIELDAGSNILAEGPIWKFQVRDLQCIGMTADIDGSGDCVVDLKDFAVLADKWLRQYTW